MSSINTVCIVGKLVRAPEFVETASKRRLARLLVETEKYVRVNNESRRVAAVHTVVCYNQFSLPALEKFAAEGVRVKVHGELSYDRNGKAEVFVPQYGGEVGLMDVNHAAQDQAPQAATRTDSTPSGGLGKLPPQRTPSAPKLPESDDLDDEIPF